MKNCNTLWKIYSHSAIEAFLEGVASWERDLSEMFPEEEESKIEIEIWHQM